MFDPSPEIQSIGFAARRLTGIFTQSLKHRTAIVMRYRTIISWGYEVAIFNLNILRAKKHVGYIYIYIYNIYGYGSMPIHTIFRGMNIHLPAILMFTRGIGFWPIPIWYSDITSINQLYPTRSFGCLKTLERWGNYLMIPKDPPWDWNPNNTSVERYEEIQGGAPWSQFVSAKLGWTNNSNFTMVYGRYM